MSLKGTKTEDNLKAAFAGESQANRRYLYFAQKADIEGYNDVAAVFRSTAEGETGHAHGHLEFLEETGDPATGEPLNAVAFDLFSPVDRTEHFTRTAWLQVDAERDLPPGEPPSDLPPGPPPDLPPIPPPQQQQQKRGFFSRLTGR